MPDLADVARSTHEQAVAAWVGYLNQVRVDRLMGALSRQDQNLSMALDHLDTALLHIGDVVSSNRGGVKGAHGFIAEVAEVGIGNARAAVLGETGGNAWVNDNGPVDLMRNGLLIQQKFSAAGGRFGLGAITEHLERYPDFVRNGGRYQIPSDHFEVIQKLHAMSAEDAAKVLSRSGDGPSLRDWNRVKTFFSSETIDIAALEPSRLEYRDVQLGAYTDTFAAEEGRITATDEAARTAAVRENRATVRQGAQVTVVAAGIEGGTAFVSAVLAKRREGTKLKEFSADDWKDIANASGLGAVKGGVRGLTIYSLTNLTATSAATANTVTTAALGIAGQASRLRAGDISEIEFIENSEILCLQAGISALSSVVGQVLIPVPVLGAVIGNTVGSVMFSVASSSLSAREEALIAGYLEDQRSLDQQLAADYADLLAKLETSMLHFIDILDRAFSPDIEVALLGAIDLAARVGVPSEEILDTDEKVNAYFLD
ncbi:hypothetical protein C5D36_02435 [Rathayibacter sp. AY1C6]|uniref:hypothetical protein n=1 Tax=unclassified Rathayibacter TaxID=2609250 RepID=UPI000CE8EBD2|nr:MULTISPECIES: hypothetical protein [unclassified Rathayibacter]PPG18129.1 hypothetical protein C5D36_02435 [Rathayibacter sp. AY1C6]PPI08469.1 hypothetical protein C5C63_03305 [Rathayibacter sp. AY1B8]